MAVTISWSKSWSASDDGTVFSGTDLENLQSDIEGHTHTGIATTLINLSDTPATYTGKGGYLVRVKPTTEDQVEFITTIDGMVIGGTTPAAGTFTTLIGSTIDGSIGSVTPAAVIGTTLKANTSLELAAGATVTEIEDNDSLGTSDTKLCTQGNVKAYVDAAAIAGSELFTSSGTFTVPTGVTRVFVTMIGGGGGGAKGQSSGNNGSGGGGSGAIFINFPFTVIPAAELTVTVGAGGAGSTTTAAGATGATSVFDSLNTVGGAGGVFGGVGGAGGGSTITFCILGRDGATTTGTSGADGAGTPFGAGGAGGDPAAAAAANTGGGGGGGDNNDKNGAAGGSGIVLVQW